MSSNLNISNTEPKVFHLLDQDKTPILIDEIPEETVKIQIQFLNKLITNVNSSIPADLQTEITTIQTLAHNKIEKVKQKLISKGKQEKAVDGAGNRASLQVPGKFFAELIHYQVNKKILKDKATTINSIGRTIIQQINAKKKEEKEIVVSVKALLSLLDRYKHKDDDQDSATQYFNRFIKQLYTACENEGELSHAKAWVSRDHLKQVVAIENAGSVWQDDGYRGHLYRTRDLLEGKAASSTKFAGRDTIHVFEYSPDPAIEELDEKIKRAEEDSDETTIKELREKLKTELPNYSTYKFIETNITKIETKQPVKKQKVKETFPEEMEKYTSRVTEEESSLPKYIQKSLKVKLNKIKEETEVLTETSNDKKGRGKRKSYHDLTLGIASRPVVRELIKKEADTASVNEIFQQMMTLETKEPKFIDLEEIQQEEQQAILESITSEQPEHRSTEQNSTELLDATDPYGSPRVINTLFTDPMEVEEKNPLEGFNLTGIHPDDLNLAELIKKKLNQQEDKIKKLPKNYEKELAKINAQIEEMGISSNLCCKELSKTLGHGIFLKADADPLKKNTFIGAYTGRLHIVEAKNGNYDYSHAFAIGEPFTLTEKERKDVFRNDADKYDNNTLFNAIVDAKIIGGKREGNFLRFVNHSSVKPNMTAYPFLLENGLATVVFITDTKVNKGEQLLYDYDTAYWDNLDIIPDEIGPDTYTVDLQGKLSFNPEKTDQLFDENVKEHLKTHRMALADSKLECLDIETNDKYSEKLIKNKKLVESYINQVSQRGIPSNLALVGIGEEGSFDEWGVFLKPDAKKLEAGSFIGFVGGTIMERKSKGSLKPYTYSLSADKGVIVNAQKTGNFAREINYSSADIANVEFVPVKISKKGTQLAIFATKDIVPGNQLLSEQGRKIAELKIDLKPETYNIRKETPGSGKEEV